MQETFLVHNFDMQYRMSKGYGRKTSGCKSITKSSEHQKEEKQTNKQILCDWGKCLSSSLQFLEGILCEGRKNLQRTKKRKHHGSHAHLHCNTNGGYLSCVFEPDNLTGQRVFNHFFRKSRC